MKNIKLWLYSAALTAVIFMAGALIAVIATMMSGWTTIIVLAVVITAFLRYFFTPQEYEYLKNAFGKKNIKEQ